MDLEAAYKQLLVSKASSWAAVIKVWDPQSRSDKMFISDVLPFGGTASVFGFNRFSRALCRLGARLFLLAWSNFFDDFPHLDLFASSEDSWRTSESFLELLGWSYSKASDKRLGFSDKLDALGVTFDFARTP